MPRPRRLLRLRPLKRKRPLRPTFPPASNNTGLLRWNSAIFSSRRPKNSRQRSKLSKLEEAKKLYAPARAYYERIEPVAEALGDLDPNIDARVNDVDAADWRGFHRIEKALWEDKTTAGTEGFADQLLKDAQLLRAKIETIDLDASLMVTA